MSVSVIIPTLNEAHGLAGTLRAVRELGPAEILVVDGGSTDGTLGQAAEADAFLEGARGRAEQMNLGAARARGDVLLFLHADCVPAPGALAAAERLLRRPAVMAGCYRMRVRAEGVLYRLLDDCATARTRLTGLIYGDQGMFVGRDTFRRLGGFPRLRLMEDLFFSRAAARHGRVVVARPRILVSARRWRQAGVVRQTLRNWGLTALAAAGVHPDRLAALYPVVR
jgi:rSAM/selenodomain-associated transferase 2